MRREVSRPLVFAPCLPPKERREKESDFTTLSVSNAFNSSGSTATASGADKQVKLSPSKIADLSKMTAFEYEKDGIRMWRLFVEKSGGAFSDDAFWVKMGDPHYIEKEEQHEEEEDEDAQRVSKKEKKCVNRPNLESSLYRCPIESCSQEFLSERNLEQHLDIVAPPKVCHVIDEAIGSLFDDTNAMESPLPMGWALSERKKSERFPDSVKSFLKKLYDEVNPQLLIKIGECELRPFPCKLNKIARAKASESRGKRDAHPEPEPDEVNDLLANDQYEGDPELEYETEPLFDVTDLMRIALTREHNNLWSKEGEKGGTEDGKGEAMEE
ncbi:hypothetical protein PRIPAC_82615 [Pristionchus pacificus]|uniref:Uncharacterized protein n=1 Tax=Pristionchus pacificus TaxID=54126 RepID=A0A2A6CPR3_PRIPA|nr:hypothetical protein PRIPAC_82615 [Pristionchus pacificus]|eukprot:PDM80129.1 hypothetical protein PRIPAC_32708 [Pristionchus pacificus]